MPEMNGAEVAQEVKRCRPALPVVMFSGGDQVMAPLPCIDALILKGDPPPMLLNAVWHLLSTRMPLDRMATNG